MNSLPQTIVAPSRDLSVLIVCAATTAEELEARFASRLSLGVDAYFAGISGGEFTVGSKEFFGESVSPDLIVATDDESYEQAIAKKKEPRYACPVVRCRDVPADGSKSLTDVLRDAIYAGLDFRAYSMDISLKVARVPELPDGKTPATPPRRKPFYARLP